MAQKNQKSQHQYQYQYQHQHQHQKHPQFRRLNTNEEKLDRRAHWAQYAVGAIVAITAWCVKLEMTVSSLKLDADRRQAAVELNRENRDKDLLQMTERIRANEVDLDWLKREKK